MPREELREIGDEGRTRCVMCLHQLMKPKRGSAIQVGITEGVDCQAIASWKKISIL